MEGKVNMENMEVLRVDEFKYLESNHQSNRRFTRGGKKRVQAGWSRRSQG